MAIKVKRALTLHNLFSFSSVGGSVLGPIIGPIVAAHAPLIWIFWVQLIFGGAVQLAQ